MPRPRHFHLQPIPRHHLLKLVSRLSSGKTGFVIADKFHSFSGVPGAPGASRINGAQMSKLGVWVANNCGGKSKVVDVAGGGAKADGGGVNTNGQWQQTLCIVNTDHPEVCTS